ncbi:hypothetical protein H5410_055975, partial [Solanum commersonii]
KIGSSKQTIKQRGKIEGSVVQGQIGREISDFYSYYFGTDVSCRRNRPNRNDEGDIDPLFPPISIFNQNGRGSKKCEKDSTISQGNEAIYTEFSKWLTEYFQTEEVSTNKKTNNRGVFIQGDVDGTGQTIEYYGVIHEIIELRYSGWPKRKIVLF